MDVPFAGLRPPTDSRDKVQSLAAVVRMHPKNHSILLAASLFLFAACTNDNDPHGNIARFADEPLRTGDSHFFSASYETMKNIVPNAIKATGVAITQQQETPDGYVIFTDKGVRASQWEYTGRVFIEKTGSNSSAVYVDIENLYLTMNYDRYPNKLFKEITAELASMH
jgi:hypothetical protein